MLNDERVSGTFEPYGLFPYRELDHWRISASRSHLERGELHGHQHKPLSLTMTKIGESET